MSESVQIATADTLIADSIAAALSRIAPNWPLDQLIAVNPYWGWSDHPFANAAKKLWMLGAAPLTMPRAYFREQWETGQLSIVNLQAALAEQTDSKLSVDELIAALNESGAPVHAPLLLVELIDRQRIHSVPCHRFVKHQISQHCAAYFDQSQARWRPDQNQSLYASWRWHTKFELGPLLQLGMGKFAHQLNQLPDHADALIATVLPAIGLSSQHWPDYLTSLLLDINGWAAWCAHEQWQAKLADQDSQQLTELLAIRLAWDWLLLQQYPALRPVMIDAWKSSVLAEPELAASLRINHILLRAMEHAFQQPLAAQLITKQNSTQHGGTEQSSTQQNSTQQNKIQPLPIRELMSDTPAAPEKLPAIQAVFCIDVRSEVFRRRIEEAAPGIQTMGFAGFFGLPIAYRPRGSVLVQPQLPGLSTPSYWVSESDASAASAVRQTLLDRQTWRELRFNPSSGFTYVETLGLQYALQLIRQNIPFSRRKVKAAQKSPAAVLKLYADPELSQPVSVLEQSRLAKQILTAMGLTTTFSRLILLCGHGAACVNNPHAAGLDCGACGGQNGAINARLLSAMLNDPELRRALAQDGLSIPDSSYFIAGLHNTTTDDVELYDLDQIPVSHQADLQALQSALADAGKAARAERAAILGIENLKNNPQQLDQAFAQRGNDWAQIRPEWGQTNNAALIVAPRQRSSGLDLAGRVFLHDYQASQDHDFSVLELIMTAPMVVANWINMQYYGSTVDNQRMGSGSKILHNVVGQRLGVFEGNGGDLRIGLPWQSVHDGHQLRHTPLRLSVFIEAPRAAMDTIMARHTVVRQLVVNHWLHLFQIDGETGTIYQKRGEEWVVFQRK